MSTAEKARTLFGKKILTLEEMRVYRFILTLEAFCDLSHAIDPVEFNREYLNTYTEEWFLCPHAERTLSCLSSHYQLGILTNGFRDTQEKKIRASPLAQYLTWFISSEDVGSLKPHREAFEGIIRRTGAEPEEILFVGDSLEDDIIGARNAGMNTVWYNPAGLIPQFSELRIKPDAIIADLIEVIELLGVRDNMS